MSLFLFIVIKILIYIESIEHGLTYREHHEICRQCRHRFQ